MVHEASVIPLLSLPDLVRGSVSLSNHNVHVAQSRCDFAHELADRHASLEGTAGQEAIVLAIWRSVNLNRHESCFCAVEVRKAGTGVQTRIVRLLVTADGAAMKRRVGGWTDPAGIE